MVKKVINEMDFNERDKIEIVENALSWVVVLAMYVYGFMKPIQFDFDMQSEVFVSELSGFKLMWFFYSYSTPYVILLGLFEAIGATLILIKRTRVIGCLFTSIILINIVLQDYFYGVPALKAAIFYQIILLFILWLNKKHITEAFKKLIRKKSKNDQKSKRIVKLVIAFTFFLIIRIIEYYLT